jgi:hypothetical protein
MPDANPTLPPVLEMFVADYEHNGEEFRTVVEAHSKEEARAVFKRNYPHVELLEIF